MKLRQILDSKGSEVYSASPAETLADVVSKLVAYNCGALVVLEGQKMVGIISERDILRACAELDEPLHATVGSRMSSEVKTGTPEDDVEYVMGVLTRHRIRHLPILDADKLAGVISIGDVVKTQYEELSNENRLLKQYIQG